MHDELEIFVEAGFTNLQALQTATLNPAIFLGKTRDQGTVDESKYADLVLLNSIPLIDINNIRDVNSVFLKGKYISEEEIDNLLE
ncbi:MAG TPA: amidohydrolase family protein [Chryseosolibacter sp.]|nr:amidohydrolase family protein [Chryseosolibacter sp.]